MQRETINVKMTDTAEDIENAKKLLKVGDSFTGEKVLQFFDVAHWVAVENEKDDDIPMLIEAKNILLRKYVSDQMRAQRFFKIESPFENSCRACRGTGEIYKFHTQAIEVTCKSCNGQGKKWIVCPSCKGSGRYKVTWKEGGGIDEECKRCVASKGTEHEHKILVDCYHCNRQDVPEDKKTVGKKMITVKSHLIKSTTPCRFCNQMGFTRNIPFKNTKAFKEESRNRDAIKNPNNHKRKKHSRTPLANRSIGEQLKEQLAKKAEQQAS